MCLNFVLNRQGVETLGHAHMSFVGLAACIRTDNKLSRQYIHLVQMVYALHILHHLETIRWTLRWEVESFCHSNLGSENGVGRFDKITCHVRSWVLVHHFHSGHHPYLKSNDWCEKMTFCMSRASPPVIPDPRFRKRRFAQ